MVKKTLLITCACLCSTISVASFEAGKQAFDEHRYTEAFNEFLPEAKKGEFRSQYYVGYLYLNGLGVNKNEAAALDFLKASADQDYDAALALMGYLYDEGRIIPMDKKQAVRYYQKASQLGNASAMFNLGLAYYKGEAINQNTQKAMELLGAVDLDEQPIAGRYLGEIYLSTTDPHRFKYAIDAYTKSAKAGDIASFYSLGQIFMTPPPFVETMYDENGDPIENPETAEFYSFTDPEKAVKFYHYAASKGYEPAQYLLGVMYINGDQVEKNLYLGHAWLEMAANQRYQPAIETLRTIDKNMTLSDSEKARSEFINLQKQVLDKIESPIDAQEKEIAKKQEQQAAASAHIIRRR